MSCREEPLDSHDLYFRLRDDPEESAKFLSALVEFLQLDVIRIDDTYGNTSGFKFVKREGS